MLMDSYLAGVARGVGLSRYTTRASMCRTAAYHVVSKHSEEKPVGCMRGWAGRYHRKSKDVTIPTSVEMLLVNNDHWFPSDTFRASTTLVFAKHV